MLDQPVIVRWKIALNLRGLETLKGKLNMGFIESRGNSIVLNIDQFKITLIIFFKKKGKEEIFNVNFSIRSTNILV